RAGETNAWTSAAGSSASTAWRAGHGRRAERSPSGSAGTPGRRADGGAGSAAAGPPPSRPAGAPARGTAPFTAPGPRTGRALPRHRPRRPTDGMLTDLHTLRDLGVQHIVLEPRATGLEETITIFNRFATEIRPHV